MEHPTVTHHSVEAKVERALAGGEAPSGSTLFRLLTDWEFTARAARRALRLPAPLRTEDRRVLEQVIFPYYAARPEMRSILFVGCAWFTRHYGRTYFPRHDFWTIDPEVKARAHGARQHRVARLEQLDQLFPEGYFDLIICNGVYGFGLDAPDECEAAFANCHSRLRPEGHLVLGWNDVPRRAPVALANVASLQRFHRVRFPPLGTSRYLTDTPYNHVYEFYCR